MWGYISTEATYQLNFNVGFSTTRSDVLVHLAQWQYWWWFWFAFLWSFYYLLCTRIVRYRSLKMRPKIVTSYRPHGKWGDFLAATIPAIWCLNILTNSNFILRLIEWQSESSLFTVRVRARQWYWVYKFELKNFTDILTAPKNVGYNRWSVNTFGDVQVTEDYLYTLQLRSQNRWVKDYWSNILQQTNGIKKNHIVSPQEQLRLSLIKTTNDTKSSQVTNNLNLTYANVLDSLSIPSQQPQNFYYFNSNSSTNFINKLNLKKNTWGESSDISYNFSKELTNDVFLNKVFNFDFKKSTFNKNSIFASILNNNTDNATNNSKLFYSDFSDVSRYTKRTQGVKLPLRIVKFPFGLDNVYDTNYNSADTSLFKLNFNLNESSVSHKTVPNHTYFVIKQQRYTKKDSIPSVAKQVKSASSVHTPDNLIKKTRYSGKPILFNNSVFEHESSDPISLYRLMKKNKARGDLIPINLARRIIRTKRTLVLPAHINITLITNSFDIVHSWFIPGLGIKLDCVPGRSTHHTFYIDSVGFYYGQCAEICGRYHHHMPIRVCALPFEHFLVWWYNFGLPRLLFTNTQKKYESYYSFRKYVW